MAVLVVPNTIEITAHGTVSGRPWASVWGMTNGAGISVGSEVEDVVKDFANNFQDHIMAMLNAVVILDGFRYVSLNSASGQTGTMAPDPGKRTAGAGTNQPTSPNVTLLVRKGASGGRGKRSGRSYLPGVHEGEIDGAGRLSPDYVAANNEMLQDFLDGVSDSDSTGTEGNRYPCVIHRPAAAREPGEDVVQGSQSRITTLTCDALVATQRRRLR